MKNNIITGTADVLGNTWLNTLAMLLLGVDARDNAKEIKRLKKKLKKLKTP